MAQEYPPCLCIHKEAIQIVNYFMFYIDYARNGFSFFSLMAFVFFFLSVKSNLLFIRYIHCNTQFAQYSKWICFKLTRILPCRLFDERKIYCVLNSWFDHHNWLFTNLQNNNDISCAKCNFRPIKVIKFHGSNYLVNIYQMFHVSQLSDIEIESFRKIDSLYDSIICSRMYEI